MADNHHASNVTTQFETAITLVKSLPKKGPYQPSYSDAGKIYSYFKQAKFGPCTEARPGFWDVINRAKWDAWSSLGDMPQETAMVQYVEEVKRIYEQVRLNEEFSQREEDFADSIVPFCLAVNLPLSPSLEKFAPKPEKSTGQENKTDEIITEEDVKNTFDGDKSDESVEKISDNVLIELDSTTNTVVYQVNKESFDGCSETIGLDEFNSTNDIGSSSDEEEEIYCDSLTDPASSMSAKLVTTGDEIKEISSSEDVLVTQSEQPIPDSNAVKSICKSISSSEESKSEFEIVEKFNIGKPKSVRYADENVASKKFADNVTSSKAKTRIPPANVLVSVPKSYARRLLHKSRVTKVPLSQPTSYTMTSEFGGLTPNEDISNESDSSLDVSITPDEVALKIVKSLSRIEIVLNQVVQRLQTVNKNMEKQNQIIASRSWWQKFIPSKFHVLALAWPILLNLIIFVLWKRRRRRLNKIAGPT